MSDVQQLEFQCNTTGSMTWTNAGGRNFAAANGVTTETQRRRDCGICVSTGEQFPSRWNNVTHCVCKT